MATSLRGRIALALGLAIGALGVVAACATSSVSSIPDCASGEERCNGVCVNVANDNANCGACGKACGNGEVCSQKACGISCTGGTSNCSGKCVDTKSDPTNCGVCGSKCATGDLCSAGKCAKNCTGGTTLCGGACIDTTSDNANCGACGTICKAGEQCVASKCASICTGGLTYCAPPASDGGVADGGVDASDGGDGGGVPLGCVNLQSDNANCGQCNNPCGLGKECKAGTCVTSPVIGVGTDPDPYRLSSGTQPISCKAFKTSYPNQGDGIYLIHPASTDLKVYCDMTNGAWTYEDFGFGRYNTSYAGWTFVGAADFSGSAQFRAAFEYLYNRDRLVNIQPGWTSLNCCFINTTNNNFYGFAGNTYMYPANQTGSSFNCNGTYSDPKMRLYLVTSAVVRDSFTQQELVSPGIYSSCTVNNNPAIFVKRYQ